MSPLEKYLYMRKKKDKTFTEDAFAKDLGISREYLSRIKRQKMQPSFELAVRIEKATAGKITALSLKKYKPGKYG